MKSNLLKCRSCRNVSGSLFIYFYSCYTVIFNNVNTWQLSRSGAALYIKMPTAVSVEAETVNKMNFSTANSFHYGLPSADSWHCDLFPLAGLRGKERS